MGLEAVVSRHVGMRACTYQRIFGVVAGLRDQNNRLAILLRDFGGFGPAGRDFGRGLEVLQRYRCRHVGDVGGGVAQSRSLAIARGGEGYMG